MEFECYTLSSLVPLLLRRASDLALYRSLNKVKPVSLFMYFGTEKLNLVA